MMRENLEEVQDRIATAAARSGRAAGEVQLIAVSKTFPSADILALHQLGQVDFGENRVQELTEKMDQLDGQAVRWHLIGHLQRNKVKEVIGRIDLFHALDSVRLAREIQKRLAPAEEIHPSTDLKRSEPDLLAPASPTLDCLVQVNVSGEGSKFGVDPPALNVLLDSIADLSRLRLCGLMTLARPVDDPEEVRSEFALLRRLRDENGDRLGPGFLSMGMSGDYEVAIEEGATHVRVGSALFGDRAYTP